MLLDDNWNLTKFIFYIYPSCLHLKFQLISISSSHFHDLKKFQLMTHCISFNVLFLIPFLSHVQFLFEFDFFLLPNKMQSTSTTICLLEQASLRNFQLGLVTDFVCILQVCHIQKLRTNIPYMETEDENSISELSFTKAGDGDFDFL